MPRGDKSAYTDKQKRQAEHIEQSEREQGRSQEAAERIAWATVNQHDGGGKKSGSGRGAKTATKTAARKSTKKATTGQAAGKKAAARKASINKATSTRATNKAAGKAATETDARGARRSSSDRLSTH